VDSLEELSNKLKTGNASHAAQENSRTIVKKANFIFLNFMSSPQT